MIYSYESNYFTKEEMMDSTSEKLMSLASFLAPSKYIFLSNAIKIYLSRKTVYLPVLTGWEIGMFKK